MPNFTQKAIRESFWKLLNEKPLSQITVKDIVEDCGINRNSFYYHFQDMPTLLEDIVGELVEKIIESHTSIDSIEDAVKIIINFVMQNKKAVYHIYNSVDRDIIERYLLNICEYAVKNYVDSASEGKRVPEDVKTDIIRYHKCECFGQIIDWMKDGMKDDILDRVHIFCEMSKDITQAIIEREAE